MVEDPKKLGKEKLATMTSRIRSGILGVLVLEPASVSDLAAELDVPPEKIRYHLNRLRDLGFIDLHGTTRRRGVAENLYSADPRKNVSDVDELVTLPRRWLDQPYARLLKLMFREASDAVQARTPSSRPEYSHVRLPIPLDEQGWDEVAAVLRQLVYAIFAAREAAQSRLEASDEEPLRASALVLNFERAEDDPP